jgi:hypothetical protein
MTTDNVHRHLQALRTTVFGLRDPLPPGASEVFNTLVDVARKSGAGNSFIVEIPHAEPGAGRAELLLWTAQLQACLRPAMD